MKKYLCITAIVCAFSFNSNAQCVKQGDVLVDAYYGFPNFYGILFNAVVKDANTGLQGLTSSSLGPMGAKAEYLLTDKFGMGLDVNYSSATINYSQTTTDQNGNPVIYNYKVTTPAMRAMVGFNFHFVRTDKVDVYAAVKTGYYHRSYSFTSDQPNYVANFKLQGSDPVAFRLEMGMRYYFTENIGASAIIGLGGGPVAALGISFKFATK